MKIIVTHSTPDMDAVTSCWIIKRFLPGWETAEIKFVPAGLRIDSPAKAFQSSESETKPTYKEDPKQAVVQTIGEDDVLHVDTGMLPLDHHQTTDTTVCGAVLSWMYAQDNNPIYKNPISDKITVKKEAIQRIVDYVLQLDQFHEIFWTNPASDIYDMTIDGILGGIQMEKPGNDLYYVDFIMQCLDALLHTMESKVSAERDIAENGIKFSTQWGKGIGFETLNDDVIKLAQKMGYMLVVRKDPRKGYVRIKAQPYNKENPGKMPHVDLTPVYEILKEKDKKATWYLHVSKKMLLNGSMKNPNSVPSKLSLKEIIAILESI